MFFNKNYKLVLGSKSPRRQELIQQITSNFEIRIQEVEENYPETLAISLVPEYLAKLKAEALRETLNSDEIIICSDTIVIANNKILGKPKNAADAKVMLNELSGKKHEVITGCYLIHEASDLSFSTTTEVYFNQLSDEMINYYIENFNPLDKAGSYGIQDWIGIVGVEKINGCFYNVMGLPVSKLIQELQKI